MYHVLDEEVYFTFTLPSGMQSKKFYTAQSAFTAYESVPGAHMAGEVLRHSVTTIKKVITHV